MAYTKNIVQGGILSTPDKVSSAKRLNSDEIKLGSEEIIKLAFQNFIKEKFHNKS